MPNKLEVPDFKTISDLNKECVKESSISELFESQVFKGPENTALVFEGQKISYNHLNQKSNQLARFIRNQYLAKTGKELTSDTLVALCLDRSPELVIGILAVLKAGGGYVPIDPGYPQDRIDYLLEDTHAELVLSKRHLVEREKLDFPENKLLIVDLDESFFLSEISSNLPVYGRGQDLAYVIYTSGTTGRPKGVMQTHHNVIRLFTSSDHLFGFDEKDVWTLFHSYVFDFSVWELWGALLYGGKLVVVSNEQTKDLLRFHHICTTEKVTVLNQTPSAFYQFLQIASQADTSRLCLKYIIFGGEALNIRQLQPWWNHPNSSETRLINMYGITETTVHVTYKEILEQEIIKSNIGKPLSDLKAYILDEQLNEVSMGETGELFIAGAGLARGYLNNDKLTNERFILNHLATAEDREKGYTRLYKTGDLARQTDSGDLEYQGRNDDQVKIRGHRIEIGEVTYAISAISGVEQSCVLAKERKSSDGIINKYLMGYYVLSEGPNELTEERILDRLTAALPSYMVPTVLMELTEFPLTINGKLDKKALPEPSYHESDNELKTPTTNTEKAVCRVWEDVLSLPQVGITDDFFRVGGDSILCIQVSSRLQKAGYPCQVSDIYKSRTVEKLSELLDQMESEVAIRSEQGLLEGTFDLLPVQKWFANQVNSGMFTNPNIWNQYFTIKVPKLDTERLIVITEQIVDHHDALRIKFTKGEKWKQTYHSGIKSPELLTHDVSGSTPEAINQLLLDWNSGFDLENGPIFQIGYLFGYPDGSARVVFAAHHILMDSVSWRILTEDIKALYYGETLPQKGSSYRQWIETMDFYPEYNPEEDAFWSTQLADMQEYSKDYQDSTEVPLTFDSEFTYVLLRTASQAYHTEVNDLLLTTLAYSLKDVNDNDIQLITLEGHGRELIEAAIDHSRTIGWYTSMFPVRLEVQNSIKETIRTTKDSLRSIPNRGLGFGAFATKDWTTYELNDLAPVSFNYLGQFDTKESDWQITSESNWLATSPENTDYNVINITGRVVDGQLEFSIVTRLGLDMTRRLAASFEKYLCQISDHCCEQLENVGSNYTPTDFGHITISQGLLDRLQVEARSSDNSLAHIFPANSLQQGFIYHSLSQKEDLAYRQQYQFEYHEPLDVGAYIKAMEGCIAQYPILRTAFNWEEGLIQVIYEKGILVHEFHDLSNFSNEGDKKSEIEKVRLTVRERDFDLTEPTLLRLHIFKQSDDFYTVIKTVHHIVTEGWSETILLKSLHEHYNSITSQKPISIKEDTAYLKAQEYINSYKKRPTDYWREVLEEVKEANDISTILSEPVDLSVYKRVLKPETKTLVIQEDIYHNLKSLSQREGITINVITQFIWHKLLQVYSGNSRTVVGTIISGRNLPVYGIENSVGLYINTLPLVVDWSEDDTILSKLHRIQNQLGELSTNGFVDLVDLQKGGERLFHSLLIYQNFPKLQGHGLAFKLNHHYHDGIDYPLCIQVYDEGDCLKIHLKYDASYLSHEKAGYHVETLHHLLHEVISNPDNSHRQLSLLKPSVYQQLVHDWNMTDKEYPGNRTIYELFQDQVVKSPNNVALVFEGQELSYQQLNDKSNQLARYIRTEFRSRTGHEMKANTLIPLYLDRSLEMVLGIIGVLKAGGAYVPMDVTHPQARIDFQIEHIEAELILTQKHFIDGSGVELPENKAVCIDLSETCYQTESTQNLSNSNTYKDLAYVIYTSGTTGKPKGVMIEHFSLCNRVHHIIDYSEITEMDFHLFKTNYIFDPSFFEIFAHLLVGASVQITKHVFDLTELENLLVSKKITSLHLVPSQYELVAATINQSKPEKIYFTGEALTSKILTTLDKEIQAHNYYGPTELGEITGYKPHNSSSASVIGKVFPNCRHYVVDENMNPVPVGVYGELYVGGAGMSRGYLNNGALTSERYVPNPFVSKEDERKGYTRLYKTGDLVRWLPDGNLEYLGRNDDQVKIRGIRVEISEVEHVLSAIEGIGQSVVLVKERKSSRSKYLVGYYTLEETSSNITTEHVFKQLSFNLPEHMIPDFLIRLEDFPLTGNGKLDKGALPEVDFDASKTSYVAPSTEAEIAVCNIWQEVLDLEQIGITDNFFKIGGNSISAIQVSHRMSQSLNCEVRVSDVFKHKTISQLLTHNLSHDQVTIPATKDNSTVLSFAQERIWFIEQFAGGTNAYHMPMVLELLVDTDVEGIRFAIHQIVKRHVVLRSTIEKGENQKGIQRIHEAPVAIEEEVIKLEKELKGCLKTDIDRSFNLSIEYPLRVKIYKIQATKPRIILLVNIHHIACDGWSVDIFQRELLAYYQAYFKQSQAASLPELSIQYKDYATWQRNHLTTEVLANQLKYWKNKLYDYETLSFPTDFVRPQQVQYQGNHKYFAINLEISEKLRALAKRCGTTLNSVLLSSVSILLSKYSGQEDIVVGSPIANRHHHQTGALIGFFVNAQVNRMLLSSTQSFTDLILKVHEDQIESQVNQDLPFEKLVDELGIERDLSRHPIFQVMFGVQSFGSDQDNGYFKFLDDAVSYEISKFDLAIFIDDSHESLQGRITYSTSLFNESTITRLTTHFQYLLDQLTANADRVYSNLSLIDTWEYNRTVVDWNITHKDFQDDKTVHGQFEAQVKQRPNLVAFVFEGEELTFLQLNEKSNQLARHIRAKYHRKTNCVLEPDTLIAMYLDRSPEMMIGVLAVLKAGGACVPIHPQYPQRRVDYLLEDTNAELILTQKHLSMSGSVVLPAEKVLHIDLNENYYQEEATKNLPEYCSPNHLAWVIYTSGTTGKPKGVMIEHRGIVNKLAWMQTNYDLGPEDVLVQKTHYTFDVSIWELLLANASGAKLIMAKPDGHLDSAYVHELIERHQVTMLHFVPSMMEVYNHYLKEQGVKLCSSLKHIMCSGEVLPKQLVETTYSNVSHSPFRFCNQYGPTEASITFTEVSPDQQISIGKAIQNTQLYVLDANKLPVPIGVIGELYMGGAGLARGYLNNKELTSDRFIRNPFATKEDKELGNLRLYKTGDMVCWRDDGKLYFAGRNDDQVKIRGLMVKLGEVAHTISEIEGVNQSCVIDKERETAAGMTKYLVGYYVLDDMATDITQNAIRDALSAILPDYMIPDALVCMDSFPVTMNGKLDKKSLPDPELGSSEVTYVAPTNELEALTCQIWEEILGLKRVGIHDNFFMIGGNSILAIQISHRMSHELDCEIKVADVFVHSTISQLVPTLESDNNEFDFGVI